MTDTKEPNDKTSAGQDRKLSLKRPLDSGTLKQSLSHGRSRAVVVEKRRKPPRLGAAPGIGSAETRAPEPRPQPPRPAAAPQPSAPTPAAAAPAEPAPAAETPAQSARPQERRQDNDQRHRQPQGQRPQGGRSGGSVSPPGTRSLTDSEREARMAALARAKQHEEEQRRRAIEEARRRAEEEARLAREREEAERKAREEDAARRAEEAARPQPDGAAVDQPAPVVRERITLREQPGRPPRADGARSDGGRTDAGRPGGPPRGPRPDAAVAVADPAALNKSTRPAPPKRPDDAPEEDEDAASRARRRVAAVKAPAAKAKPDADKRRGSRLTVTMALTEDGFERTRSLASMRRAREREKRLMRGENQPPQKVVRDVIVPETITLRDLADRMAVRSADLIKLMMKQGQMMTVNDVVDADTAQLLAEEFGHTVKRVAEADVELGLHGAEDAEEALVPRAPVVTIMGHVDHGKTSLLDALRSTDVAAGEAGGITQHIGAYQVTLEGGNRITFLDTPGHAAFTAMRARGAKVTDIVILVVAADDGVMPQTIEAINHARAAEVPIIVAVNKIDKPEADPARVLQGLLQHEIVTEEFGGEIQAVKVSALKRTGLDDLTESIQLQAEILDLKANPDRPAQGAVIEAKLDRGRGAVATVLVQKGTLKVGDIFVMGQVWGRARMLVDDKGQQLREAGPSMPVEVLGLSGVPLAGDDLIVVESEAKAREIADYRERKAREAKRAAETQRRGTFEQMLAQLKDTNSKEYPLVIKGDVQGSVEAIVGALDKLSTEEVRARPIHTGVGGITENDVTLALASKAPIIAFNVRASQQARDLAQAQGVEIRYYSIIYDLVDDAKAAMSGLLEPTIRETFLGNAEILEVFNITKVGKVAGCRVTEGVVRRGSRVRLVRDNVVIHEGKLGTLRRFKDEVKEVQSGQECGMAFENYQDIQKGDVIECFDVETITRTL